MNKNYAIELGVVTVAELIETLQALPERCMNWPVCCCGTDMFLCINEEERHLVVDTEDLFEEYEDVSDLIEVKKRVFPWE